MYRDGGKEFSNLPRKFKTSVAACPLHCHQPQINDIGVFGVIREQTARARAGRSWSAAGCPVTPHYAQGLRVFIPEAKMQEQVPEIFRHIAHIFRDSDELRVQAQACAAQVPGGREGLAVVPR